MTPVGADCRHISHEDAVATTAQMNKPTARACQSNGSLPPPAQVVVQEHVNEPQCRANQHPHDLQ